MTLSPSIASLIKEKKISEITKCIKSSDFFGMNTLNQSLYKLLESKTITFEVAMECFDSKKELN